MPRNPMSRPGGEEGARTFTYHAEYVDADDVRGTVEAIGISEAIVATAEDLLHQVGKDPTEYGRLTKVTVSSDNGGLTATVTPEYDDA